MELRQLKIFVTVAETLDFAQAAEMLRLHSQIAEDAVHALEEEIGVTLFYCLGRKKQPALTKAGEVFYKKTTVLLSGLETACTQTRHVHCGEAGTLSIAFSQTAEFDLLPLFVHAFSRAYPLAKLRLLPMKSLDQARALQNGSVHAGLLSLPSETAGFSFRVIRGETLSVALPPGHALAREGTPLRIQHLADEGFIMPRRETDANFYDMLGQFFANEAMEPRVLRQADSVEEMLSLVAAGSGIALIPGAKAANRQDVAFRSLQSTNSALKTVLGWNKDNPALILRAFLEAAEQVRVNFPQAAVLPARGEE